MIRYLKHKEIDKQKWDTCIENASNSLIYAYSWYLDIVSPNWDALIMGDYEAVMPLTWRRKFGIPYVFLPFFAQQLGVFSVQDKIQTDLFVKRIPSRFKIFEQNFNENNHINTNVLRVNSNYKINISRPYSKVYKGYNRNCKRNLQKAEQAGFKLSFAIQSEKFVSFIKENLDSRLENFSQTDYQVLENLIGVCLENNTGELVGLFDNSDIMHAAGFYLKSGERLIFSVCASTEYGKQNQGMYLLVDNQIKKYSGSFKWHDFSGSNNKGIAYFNSTFGAEPVSYKTILINKLAWWRK